MVSLSKVIQRALKLVTPGPGENKRLDLAAAKVTSRLEEAFIGRLPIPEISLGGSYARGTWLKGSLDIDFFLLYSTDYPREKLESEAIDAAKGALHGYRINQRFAEHPYVEGFVDDVRVNLVPCYKVALGEWCSAADRSPYHTTYIRSKLDDRLRLEARLLKKFVKRAGVYGAEVKVRGFSGYVCEVLTLKYGSFESSLEGLAKLKNDDRIISIEKYDKDLAFAFASPLVILDPVDTTRNLGSAISARNVAKLVLQSRRFLEKPSLSYFSENTKKVSYRMLSGSKKMLIEKILVLSFENEKRSPDILWGQLRRSSVAISNKLGAMGFQVLRVGMASNEDSLQSAFLFLFADAKLGSLQMRQGPEYFRIEEVKKYFEKNRRKALLTWIGEDG
ncbi:MAG: CCA tRNA nucleotidyltransferase, partial [Nitrososphaerales archaeon]